MSLELLMDNDVMKRQIEMVEGPEAWKRFEGVMKNVLAVPHSEIQRRITQQGRKATNNPNRRGPKRTAKPSATPNT
jgi:hypothetical protein